MVNINGENKKIAQNTIFMYIRLFTTMFVGLYTSRIVLLTLGVSDFGIYNVVGGFLAIFTFISGSLMGATTRFLNLEMGKPNGDVNQCFNINFVLHLALASFIFLLAETIGVRYIYNNLNIEPGKLGDAMFVYQVAIITSCLGIINEPYASLFNAFERFGFLAAFDIVNTFIRLSCVILLQYYDGSALRLYAIIMSLTTVNTFIVYHWIAYRDWAYIIKLRFVRGWHYYKEVLVFSNWNLFATAALMARSAGCDLLINSFFGTAVNGAFAVSKTINNYVTSFSSNFDSASGPQITQSYSAGNIARCNYLANKLGRFCLLLFELVFFPLYIELDYILHLWLKKVPDGVLTFCQWNLLLAAVALTCGGIVQVINASGKIKWFKMTGGLLFIMCVPIGYYLYKIGAPAYSTLILFLIIDVINRVLQLVLLKYIIGYDSWGYVKEAYSKPCVIAVIMSTCLYVYSFFEVDSGLFKLFAIVACLIITSILVFTIGLTKGEKAKFFTFAKIKLNYISIKERIEWYYANFLKYHFPYLWCKKLYKESIGRPCNFSNPKDINEKILWLSFFTDTFLWTTLADKYAVREYVKDHGEEDILVPLLGKWDNAEDIYFDSLPDKFVLKPNNGSYDCCIITDKSKVDLEAIRKKMNHSLKHRFGYEGAEVHYTRMKPCIIAERLLETNDGNGLVDYKIWCFNGKPYCIFVCANRDPITHHAIFQYYDLNWQKKKENIAISYRNDSTYSSPPNLSKLLQIASKLSAGLPQCRVDLYNVDGKVYFGEMTLTSNYGMMPYFTQQTLDDMGAHCTLPSRSLSEKMKTFLSRWFPKF